MPCTGTLAKACIIVDDQQDRSVRFLLGERRRLNDNYLHSEEIGDRRVTFFISFTTAIVGGLAALATITIGRVDSDDTDTAIAILVILSYFGLVAILLLGSNTLARVLKRNEETDKLIQADKDVAKYFVDRDEQIRPYLLFQPFERKQPRNIGITYGSGGLVQTVAIINGLAVMAFPGLSAFLVASKLDAGASPEAVIYASFAVLAIVLGWGAWVLQVRYANSRERDWRRKLEEGVRERGMNR